MSRRKLVRLALTDEEADEVLHALTNASMGAWDNVEPAELYAEQGDDPDRSLLTFYRTKAELLDRLIHKLQEARRQ